MAVRGNHHSTGPGIAFFNHDLVTDTATCGIKIGAHFTGKSFYLSIFFQIFFGFILNVVVKGINNLSGIEQFFSADLTKFGNNRTGIVMGHNVSGLNHNVIAAVHDMTGFKIDGKALRNFFNQILSHISLPNLMVEFRWLKSKINKKAV